MKDPARLAPRASIINQACKLDFEREGDDKENLTSKSPW